VVQVNNVTMTEEPTDIADAAEPAAEAGTSPSAKDAHGAGQAGRRVSLSVRTLLTSLVILVLAVALGVMTWLYLGERATVQAQVSAVEGRKHAEQIALDYAVQAAAMNFQDINTWKNQLTSGTSPELTDKLTKAAKSMEQLLIPLQWTSTAQPLTAKVRTDTNGVYVVDTFVSVLTKTTQAPDNLQSTATYSITIDSGNNWLITDVGGIGAVVGGK
jgi:Mce-associated membrane protein